ncbi:MAG: TauD/TfdA family dioxygenase, partial [Pseudomonadota bacterium]|nr:TauD/TfdA family dioxygenase [Pseudomonadota bacterium]
MPHAKPLTPVIGAEISGIDLRQPLSIDGVQWLTDQLVRYKVIFFRDQDIDPQQHLDFAREFGPLET